MTTLPLLLALAFVQTAEPAYTTCDPECTEPLEENPEALGDQLWFSRIGQGVSWRVTAAAPTTRPALGSPLRVRAHAAWTSGPWTAAFAVDQDPGEYRLPDHTKGSVQYRSERLNLVIGAFRVRVAHGLTLGSPRFGRAISSPPRMPLADPLTPYTGFDESSFLRGIGASIRVSRRVDLILAASRQRLDASVDSLESGVIARIRRTGLHVSDSEKAGRGMLQTTDLMGGFAVREGRWSARAVVRALSFGSVVSIGSGSRERHLSRLLHSGLSLSWGASSVRFSAETAFASTGGWASSLAIHLGRVAGSSFRISTRMYGARFAAMGQSAPSAWSGSTGNERGVSIRHRARLSHILVLTTLSDWSTRPQAHALFDRGLKRREQRIMLERSWEMAILTLSASQRVVQDLRRVQSLSGATISAIQEERIVSGALRLTVRTLGLGRIRLGYALRKSADAEGAMAAVSWEVSRARSTKLVAQMASYRTESGDVRLGLYRYSVPFDMPLITLSGAGTLLNLMCATTLTRGTELHIRLSRLTRVGRVPQTTFAVSIGRQSQ